MAKTKFTVSIDSTVNNRFDRFLRKLNKGNKSEAVEQAMQLWLRKQDEAEDDEYYERAAAEMNADAADWVRASSESTKRKQP